MPLLSGEVIVVWAFQRMSKTSGVLADLNNPFLGVLNEVLPF